MNLQFLGRSWSIYSFGNGSCFASLTICVFIFSLGSLCYINKEHCLKFLVVMYEACANICLPSHPVIHSLTHWPTHPPTHSSYLLHPTFHFIKSKVVNKLSSCKMRVMVGCQILSANSNLSGNIFHFINTITSLQFHNSIIILRSTCACPYASAHLFNLQGLYSWICLIAQNNCIILYMS